MTPKLRYRWSMETYDAIIPASHGDAQFELLLKAGIHKDRPTAFI